jgi:hypothetical protein
MEKPKDEMAPLLKKYMTDFENMGIPPAYIVQKEEQ